MSDPLFAGRGGRARHELRLFLTALQFFTRVPVPRWVGFSPDWLNHCTRYYPMVGLFVGMVGATVYGFSVQWWTPAVAVVLCIAATVYMTGAFHEDGWADTCDGLGGTVSRERAFEIMKDSRIGTYGTAGLVLLLGLKLAALAGMSDTRAVMAALIVGHTVSRLCSATLIVWITPRKKGRPSPWAIACRRPNSR